MSQFELYERVYNRNAQGTTNPRLYGVIWIQNLSVKFKKAKSWLPGCVLVQEDKNLFLVTLFRDMCMRHYVIADVSKERCAVVFNGLEARE